MSIEYVTVKVLPDGRMSAKDAAKYIGFSLKTLAMMRCKNEGPSYIKRGRIFYYKDDLDRWLNDAYKATTPVDSRPIGEIIEELGKEVPPEEWEKLNAD